MDIATARRVHADLLANKPEGAAHNSDICPFCVDKATEDSSTVPDPSRSNGGLDVSDTQQISNEHGGRDTYPMSDMISKETHEALMAKAVADATSATEQALDKKVAEASELAAKVEKLEADNAGLKADNDRLNGELDTAQVSLKAATDKVEQLEGDIAKMQDEQAKAELASQRAEQVKNLKLYDDQYVAERASKWAELTDEAWAERLDEWQKLNPTKTDAPATDAASAMSGTSGELTKDPSTDTAGDEKKPSSRRAVLGLN